jgi:hypothetical protein
MSLCEDQIILLWVLNAGSVIVTSHAFGQHISVTQLMTDFNLFQSHLLSQSGNNAVLLMLFVIMTGFFPLDNFNVCIK